MAKKAKKAKKAKAKYAVKKTPKKVYKKKYPRLKNCRRLDAGDVTRAVSTVCFPEANFKPAAPVDERGCRRDIRSNGRVVVFNRVRSDENRFGGRKKFSSSVRIQRSAISPALLAGWDLVLTCSPTPSFPARRAVALRCHSQKSLKTLAPPNHGFLRDTLRRWLSLCQTAG